MLRTLCRLRPRLYAISSALPTLSPPSVLRPPVAKSFTPVCAAPFSSSRKRKGAGEVLEDEIDKDDVVPGVFLFGIDQHKSPRFLVVQPRIRPDSLLDLKLSEALNLAKSLQEQRDDLFHEDFATKQPPSHIIVQNPSARSSKSHADTYFGPGTVDNIKTHLKALTIEDQIDVVFVNASLSGIQQRNLEISLGKPVLDRIGLIIEIFHSHAETKEAKLQSELAALMYKRSRLVRIRGPHGRLTFGLSGEAEVVSGRGKGSGGRGSMSGAGETELHLQRRRIQERRIRLVLQIDEVRRTRALQRSSRKRHGGSDGHGLATVAVVGYTNAGKSTLVSALSNSDLYRDDRLFATVDPRLRSVFLPSGRKALLSDTVGFISDLPVQLVEAFHATLEEVVEADLLLHVLDSSAPNVDEQRSSVLEVLEKIGVSEEKIQNMIEVWNKIDLLNKNAETLFKCVEQGDVKGTVDLEDDIELKEAGEYGLSSKNQNDEQIRGLTEVASRIETSAITGVGLKELLYIVDEKLVAQKLVDKTSCGPFNQKWRPSPKMEFSDIVAEQ